MKICRFDDNRIGLVVGDEIHDVTDQFKPPSFSYPLPRYDLLMAELPQFRKTRPVKIQKLLSPVANPGKIMAAPVNYTKHLQEALADKGIHHGNLVAEIHKAGIFLKASSAVVGPGEGVRLVHTDRRNDHEVELAVVIGRQGRKIPEGDALAHVAGYCIGLDMTIRGPEERSMRKSPDSYCVLGPWLATPDEVPDPGKLELSITVNGETRQQANTSDLIVSVPALIAWASSFYTLYPGDVLLTGTPQGVGPVKPGDVMKATIERIGSMEVKVTAA
ncbi:MAG TPA: fumarylacetoacetate hydrolase family protein [Burkholderiales bacterium]|nr:fumarylacetoacetate hydrolase family protein [Burkholderiales bacterium]